MSGIDWIALALGTLAGLVTSALFFAGLALGLRLAMRRARPMAVLAISAVLRISTLLAAGWLVAKTGGATAVVGFGLAFFIIRFAAVALAQPAVTREV